MDFEADKKLYHFKTSTLIATISLDFQIGVEFEEKTPDGRQVRTLINQEGDTFIAIQTALKQPKINLRIKNTIRENQPKRKLFCAT